MKMKILTVAVFCAYIVAVFSKGFNRTMSRRLTGKSLPPPIVHDAKITRKLSTLFIVDGAGKLDSLGVLLGRKRIAFPKRSWEANLVMRAMVYCFIEEGRPLILRSIFLKDRIPEKERLYLAKGIVEVELAEEVPRDCWPENEQRYTVCAAKNEMKPEDDVFAITLAVNKKDTSEKPYMLAGFEDNRYVQIKCRPDMLWDSSMTVPGEPLFHGEKIAGMCVAFNIKEEEGKIVTNELRYVLFRKQSIGQSSN